MVAGWLSLDRAPLGAPLGATVRHVDTFGDQAGNPAYYVVYLDPAGFVIVAGDDLVEPIIGFAPAGRFDPSDANPLGALVTRDVPARVAHARKLGATSSGASERAQAKWRRFGGLEGEPLPDGPSPQGVVSVSDVRIAPLTQSTWDQGTVGNISGAPACYNYYTPPYGDGNNNNYWAGCVATAMAQLMRYYQYPTAGVGTAAFTIYSDGSPLTYNLHGGDNAGGPYVWSNMPLVPNSSTPTLQCQAIGALVADAGASVNMSYTASGSAASDQTARNQLVSTFHFGNARFGYSSGANIGAGLTGMINPNLDARYPVMLGIEPAGGHEVIADGYGYSASTLYHHLNLGWSGVDTAWYALPLVDTSNGTFTVVDACVYNAYTNGTGEIISGRVLDQISRPVVNASVSATRSGGGTYTATTDTNGIYALARIPSGSSYSITVTKANYGTVSGNFSTTTSSDRAAASGNYWGANFTMNMLTTAIDHLAWGAVAATQPLNTPFGVSITAQNLTNGVATGFTGPVALSAYRTGVYSTNILVGNLGASQTQTDSSYNWTFGYAFTPSTNLQAISVRSYSGTKVSIWTDSGAFVASQSVNGSPGVWTETPLDAPIALSAGTTYRLTVYYPVGSTRYSTYYIGEWPTTFANGTVGQNYYYISADGFPNSIAGTGIGPFLDLRYTTPFSNSVAVAPTSSGSFVSGVWSGNVTVGTAATNVVLKADDGAGHAALSTPFTLFTPIRLLSPQRPPAGNFQCTVSSALGLRLEILASSNLQNWDTVATLTNSTGTTNYTDTTSGLPRRFYRALQLP